MLMSILYHVTFLTGTACAVQLLDLGNITSGVNNIPCAFDMCVIIPNFCLNGGTCLTSKDTCESTCICSKKYAGKRCDVTEPPRLENKNAEVLTTKPSNACESWECNHGKCIEIKPIGIRCICDDGWFGESCNTYGAVFDSSIFNIPSAEVETNNFLTPENENTLQGAINRPLPSSVFHSVTSTRSPLTSSVSINITNDVDDDFEERNVTREFENSEKIKTDKENDSISSLTLSSEIQNLRNLSMAQQDDINATNVFPTDTEDISSIRNSSNDDINDYTENKNNSVNVLVNATHTDNGQQQTSDEIAINNVTNTDERDRSVKSNHTLKNTDTHDLTLEKKKYIKGINVSASLGLDITPYITTTLEFPGELNHISRHETKLDGTEATFENDVTGTGEQFSDVDNSLDQKYNVCSDYFEMRSLKERKCEVHDSGLTCVYGECEQSIVDHGSWTGYQTDCKCDYGATGTYCENKCCLDCGVNGKCDVVINDDNFTEHCNCRQRYTGEFCEIFIPDPVSVQIKESTWYLWIVGVCVGTFVLMVTLSVVAPYFMWKHRVILVMKIVHYFQAYEDDDEKEWDAFVSYKSHPTDESFVTDVLYPKLEKELGFRLCLHFRDFVPGETISNNIINAVEGSRRTIIILTPRYVESEFTRFEYQKAQTEMLKRKHRIIPIMLEDISGVTSNMDKNLKGIINSVTYLEWPHESEKSKKEDKFWKRLQLSLPKKKISDSEKDLSPLEKSLTSGANNNQPINHFSDSKRRALEQQKILAKSLPVNNSEMFNVSLSDYADEETYFEIGQIDDTLTEMIQPLTDAEEAALVQSQIPNSVQEASLSHLGHDVRYMEFKKEDNPPSPSIVRSQNKPEVGHSGVSNTEVNARTPSHDLDQNTAQYTDNNYLQFKIEDNPPSPNLLRSQIKSEQTDSRYNELKEDDKPASPSIQRSLIQPEVSDYDYSYTDEKDRIIATDMNLNFAQYTENNYSHFKTEDNPPSPSLHRTRNQPDEGIYDYSYSDVNISPPFYLDKNNAHCSENNYLEFKIEDNPPSPSISRSRKQSKPEVTLCDDNYTELEIEGNLHSPKLNGLHAPFNGTNMFDGYTDISEKGTSSLHDLNILLIAGTDKQYVEFRAGDNPPSPSLNKLRKQPNGLSRKRPDESNTDDDYTDITMADDEVDFHVPSPDMDDRYIDIRTENLYTCPPNRTIPKEQTTPRAGIIIANNGYIEAEV